jgi:hypothetical protein
MAHQITFRPSGRGKAQCAPNPEFPNGVAINMTTGADDAYCGVPLPYPAPECGAWVVTCECCSMTVAITAAGRPDDPVSVLLPCARAA